MSPIAERIQQRMDLLATNGRAVALAIGSNTNVVYDILKGRVKNPRMDTLEKLARVLRTTPDWLATGRGPAEDPAAGRAGQGAATGDGPGTGTGAGTGVGAGDATRGSASATGPERIGEPLSPRPNVDPSSIRTDGLVGPRDFPIYSSAQGGATGMVLSYEPIEMVRRPEPLFAVKGGFGMYVVGDSMEPVYEQGDMLLVHPGKPPQRGDDVLLVLHNGDTTDDHAAMVKRLVSYDDTAVRLRQYNPPHDFEIPRTDILSLHLIVGSYKRR